MAQRLAVLVDALEPNMDRSDINTLVSKIASAMGNEIGQHVHQVVGDVLWMGREKPTGTSSSQSSH